MRDKATGRTGRRVRSWLWTARTGRGGRAEPIDPEQPQLLDYDARWAGIAAHSEVVFRVIADIGVDEWDVALKRTQQAIDDGYSGVSFEDGEGALSRYVLDISDDWVDFAHVDAEQPGIDALPLDHAQCVIEEIRGQLSGGPTGG